MYIYRKKKCVFTKGPIRIFIFRNIVSINFIT